MWRVGQCVPSLLPCCGRRRSVRDGLARPRLDRIPLQQPQTVRPEMVQTDLESKQNRSNNGCMTHRARCGAVFSDLTFLLGGLFLSVYFVLDHQQIHCYCGRSGFVAIFLAARGGCTVCRWVHLDSCEAAFDKPLLYESGWGKSVSYVVAVGRDGVADVTRRYTSRRKQVLPRRSLVTEQWLAQHLSQVTRGLRAGLPSEAVAVLEARDAAEQAELEAERTAPGEELPGRQSGAAEWVSSRAEGGAAAPAAASGKAIKSAPRPPTRYYVSPDRELLQVFHSMGRLTGGACRAAGKLAFGLATKVLAARESIEFQLLKWCV